MTLYYQDRQFTNAEDAYREILANIHNSFKVFFIHVKIDIIPILNEWIHAHPGETPEARQVRRYNGQSRHMLVFQDYTNLARCVMGTFLSECKTEEHEIPLAIDVINSHRVNQLLVELLVKYRNKQNELLVPKSTFTQFCKSSKALYKPLYNNKQTTIEQVLDSPESYSFNDKIVSLHDLTEFLKVNVPDDKTTGTYYKINNNGYPEYERRPLNGSSDFRFSEKNPDNSYKHYTLKEHTGFIIAARINGMPIWAGPSFTTARLLFAAQSKAGANQDEINALAWGIFAFWNQCYPESSTWIHRFHAVMDMAFNFGVYYEPFVYPKAIPF